MLLPKTNILSSCSTLLPNFYPLSIFKKSGNQCGSQSVGWLPQKQADLDQQCFPKQIYYLHAPHSSQIFIILGYPSYREKKCVFNQVFFKKSGKLWNLISWLLRKPADLHLQCFQKRIDPGSAHHGLTL